jgi:hypothetical protein
MGTGSFPGVKNGRGVTLTPLSLVVPWSWKGRAIPLRPLRGRTACTEPQCLYKGALYLFTIAWICSFWPCSSKVVGLTFKNLASYIYRTVVPLPSRCCILYIFFSTTISTDYFKHAAHSPFFSSKCRLFHNATFFCSCIIHILHTGVLKFKCKTPVPKGLMITRAITK